MSQESEKTKFVKAKEERVEKQKLVIQKIDNEVFDEDAKDELLEKIVHLNRCAKVVKGGRRFSFSALMVVGNQKGSVGFGIGKAREVSDAIRKGIEVAKKKLQPIVLRENTIPHEVIGRHDAGCVLLRPAAKGTGVIAGGAVRAVLEAVGIRDILAKSLGAKNSVNVVRATIDALLQLKSKDTYIRVRGLMKNEDQ